jgi:hypothetical protein
MVIGINNMEAKTPVRQAIDTHKKGIIDIAEAVVENISEEKKTTLKDAATTIFTKGHKSKTIWFAYGLIGFGILQEILPQVESMIPPQWYGMLTSATGVAVMALRYVTTTSLDDKE